ncbi:MAG: hypothetical protein ACI4JN_00930 [Ruminococcus sp.]
MKKVMYGIALAAVMGTSVLLTGCGSATVTVKNSLPQEFNKNEGDEIASTITINDINCDIDGETLSVKVSGECTYVSDTYNEGDLVPSSSIDAVLLDKDGNVVSRQMGNVRLSIAKGEAIEEEFSFTISNEEYVVELVSE